MNRDRELLDDVPCLGQGRSDTEAGKRVHIDPLMSALMHNRSARYLIIVCLAERRRVPGLPSVHPSTAINPIRLRQGLIVTLSFLIFVGQ